MGFSIRELHDQVMESNDFARLEPFCDPKSWEPLDPEERELLSSLFVLKGEVALETGQGSASEAFGLAQELIPDEPRLLVWLAMLYVVGDCDSSSYLSKAIECAEKALEIDPSYAAAHKVLGGILSTHTDKEPPEEQMRRAVSHYEKYAELSDDAHEEGSYWWERARAEHLLAIATSELQDHRTAIDSYRKANRAGVDNCAFWTEFGDSVFVLALALHNSKLLQEAINHFQKVAQMEPEFPLCWLRLGVAYSRLFALEEDEGAFIQAEDAFSHAAQGEGEEFAVWHEWGMLLLQAAERLQDLDMAEQSFEKFSTADLYDANRSEVLNPWISGLVLVGMLKERLDFLREAEEKVAKLVEVAKRDANSWATFSYVYYALGQYFGDEEYYQQAIQGAEVALSIDAESVLAWNHLAQTYLSLAESRGDIEAFKKAERAFRKLAEIDSSPPAKLWQDWGTCALGIGTISATPEFVEGAIERFDRAIETDGDRSFAVLMKLGMAHAWLGDYHEDTDSLRKGIELLLEAAKEDREDPHVWFNLGLSYSHLATLEGDVDLFEAAATCFEKATGIDVEDEQAYLEWGLSLIHMAQMTDYALNKETVDRWALFAEEKLSRAAQLGSGEALYNLACLYSMGGRFDWAMELLYKAKSAGVLPPPEELRDDEWLERIRGTEEFEQFMSEVINAEE